jgi:hypothetical protein
VQIQRGPAGQIAQGRRLALDDRQALRIDVDLAAVLGAEAAEQPRRIQFERRLPVGVSSATGSR